MHPHSRRVQRVQTPPQPDIGVIIVAIIIWKVQSSGKYYADPAMSLVISLVIFGSALPLSKLASIFLFFGQISGF